MPSLGLSRGAAVSRLPLMAQGMYLSQKMALTQVLAPQLQQSLVLLQAPTLELKALVEQELQQNPILEEAVNVDQEQDEGADRTGDEVIPTLDPAEPPVEMAYDPATEKPTAEPVDDFQAEFDKLLQLDQEWRDHFSQSNVPLRQREDEEEKRQYMFDSLAVGTSLQEVLLEQVRLSDLTEEQQPVAEMIIGNIDDRGYLRATVDELAFSTNIPADKIAEVLRAVQAFEPPGVGARDLRECLMLQLERRSMQESLEYRLLRDHMEALGKHRFPELARQLELPVETVQSAAERISHLEPWPGREFLPDDQQYVVPEVFVQKVRDEYVVTTNNEFLPHLRISNTYKDLMAQASSTPEIREYIRDKIRAGKFLIKSLYQRQETILKIAQEIVKRQRDFMEIGVTKLRPLTMLQVAEVVGVHETTVSRAVSGKYMQTPQGVYEMKFFFTSGIKTLDGKGIANTSIKDMLAEMIKKENSGHPLSDEELVKMLGEKSIHIARRTVAKYRSELNILPSNLRKIY